MAKTTKASSSSTDHQNHYTYEVFLSFRGEDTRYSFTDHLHTALCQRGIVTFRDDNLRRGEDISQELLKAIEESRVSIIVFSQNYASSRWCLDELVKILECRKWKGHEVRAVFYKVDPSDVRKQTGAFGEAFAKLDQCKYKDSLCKWRKALEEAADLSGWPFKDGEYESKFINDIVEELSTRVVNPSCELHVAAHPIGIESCRQNVYRLLYAEQNTMVGIWGIGGIGKTTIAKALFNSIRHKFEGSCFLSDVRSNDLVQLQDRLLFSILRDSTLKVSSVDQGVTHIKARMRHKRILLILDDVSHSSQLQNLVPSPDCLGPGSKILITTRDKRWLLAHQVDEVYEVKMLNYGQALNLFSLNAFKRTEPPNDYLELTKRAVQYAQGLPLALIVLGSHLFRKSRDEWEATLDSCKGEDPHREIRNVLRISYDDLGIDLKGYFLDIACFFKGKNVEKVKQILEACYDLKPVIGIAQLQEKALIRIDENRIWMHDLIEEMGKDIVYQESHDKPGECSRVWSSEDVDDILTNNTGTNKVLGIQVHVPWRSPEPTISLNAKSFSQMRNLRYFFMSECIKYECSSGDIDFLSNQLRWLYWRRCPLLSFPPDFHANKLVHFNISNSPITHLWEGRKKFSRLTYMNLSGCTSLTELPDFSGIPNLTELNLSRCHSLVKIPDSVGFLYKLVTLTVHGCYKLVMFPRKIHWRSLTYMNLSGCASLTELPDFSGIPNLTELNLSRCHSLVKIPDSVGFLYKLVTLTVHGCYKLVMFPRKIHWRSLTYMNLSGCASLIELPDFSASLTELLDFSGIPNLTELNLSRCHSLVKIPDSVGFLYKLVTLTVHDCYKLVMFPRKIHWRSLTYMNLSGCASLTELPDFSGIPNLTELNLSRCHSLVKIPDSVGFLYKLVTLTVHGCYKLVMFPRKIHLRSLTYMNLSGCASLTELPDFSGIPNLTELNLSRCHSLVKIPDSVGFLYKLVTLTVHGCYKLVMFPRKIHWRSLTCMNLSGCASLTELPDFSGIPNLTELNLSRCHSLVKIPDSVGFLYKLVTLTVHGCYKLVMFPRKIHWRSLTCMNLSGCASLTELPDFSGIPNLTELNLSRCHSLVKIPDSVGFLYKLVTLTVHGCYKLVMFPRKIHWRSLTCMNLSGCASLTELPDFSGIPNLTELNLSRCHSLVKIPDSVGFLYKLVTLTVHGCYKLVMFPRKIHWRSLTCMNLSGCASLTELPDFSGIPNLTELNLSRCHSLVKIPDSVGFLYKLVTLTVHGCYKLVMFPRKIHWRSLTCMNLSGCASLTELPDFSGIPNLTELNLSRCHSLVKIPDSVGFLYKLVTLTVHGCYKLIMFPRKIHWRSLTCMNLSGCASLTELPDFSEIPNLTELNLSRCHSLVKIPDSVGFLYKLVTLTVHGCYKLVMFPRKIHWRSLTCMNLSGCASLTELPDFSGIPNLTELNLSRCHSLVKIPDSVGFLYKLVTLTVHGCYKLVMFPRKIHWRSIQTLSISSCKLEQFSEVGEEIGSLRCLEFSSTGIKELHPSITKFVGLEKLELLDCGNLATFSKIPIKMDSMRILSLSGSGIRELDESIGNLIGLKELVLMCCNNLTTLPYSIYGFQNLETLSLRYCSKLGRFPTNTNSLNVDGCSLSLPKLKMLDIGGCSLSDCDFLMTLDCWETLYFLDLSCNNFVSIPACIRKFVNLEKLYLYGNKRLREIPELPPKVHPDISCCESLERFSKWKDPRAVIEAASPSTEDDYESLGIEAPSLSTEDEYDSLDIEAPLLSTDDEYDSLDIEAPLLSTDDEYDSLDIEAPLLSTDDEYDSLDREAVSTSIQGYHQEESETLKRHLNMEEPSMASPTLVIPPKRQCTTGQASEVHFAHELAITPVPIIPDLHSSHHSVKEPTDLPWLSRGAFEGDQD